MATMPRPTPEEMTEHAQAILDKWGPQLAGLNVEYENAIRHDPSAMQLGNPIVQITLTLRIKGPPEPLEGEIIGNDFEIPAEIV